MVKAPFLLVFILKKIKTLYLLSPFPQLKFFVFIYLITVSGVAFSQSNGNGGGSGYSDAESQDIARKYALKIGVSIDSLEFIHIYQVMDKWSEFVTTNPDKIGSNSDAVFAQFMYYLAFRTKIPADVGLLYKDRKTYLFRNLIYLRPGDLLFYGKNSSKPDKLAFYLQNNYVVFPDANGSLQFQPYKTLEEKFSLTAAKIDRDE